MNLQLSLIKKWFKLTKDRIKLEDYREITPYWCNRILLYDGKPKPVKWWEFIQEVEGCFFRKAIENMILKGEITFKKFSQNTMTLGYPKKTDTERILKLKHKGIRIGTGNTKWGAERYKVYFVIIHDA